MIISQFSAIIEIRGGMGSMDKDNERNSVPGTAKTPAGKGRKAAAGKSRVAGRSGSRSAAAGNKDAAAEKSGKPVNSTAKKAAKPARRKTGVKSATIKKKAGTRKKTAGKAAPRRRKSAVKSGAAGDLPVLDPPPVELPPVPAEAADDPRSLSWMAARAVSALNAVKAHQAEKGKLIMARSEKETVTQGSDVPLFESAPEGMMPSQPATAPADPPIGSAAAEPEVLQSELAAAPVPGATGADAVTPEPSQAPENTAVELPAVQSDSPVTAMVDTQGVPQAETKAAARPVPSTPVNPPPPVRRRKFSRHRMLAALAILGVLVIGFWRSGDYEVIEFWHSGDYEEGGSVEAEGRPVVTEAQPLTPDTTGVHAAEESAAKLTTAQPADMQAPGANGWVPSTLESPQPGAQTLRPDTESPPPVQMDASAGAGVEAEQSATASDAATLPETAATDRIPDSSARATTPVPVPAVAPAPAAAPVRVPAVPYGYYPPQGTWRQPPPYQPAYARPPAR